MLRAELSREIRMRQSPRGEATPAVCLTLPGKVRPFGSLAKKNEEIGVVSVAKGGRLVLRKENKDLPIKSNYPTVMRRRLVRNFGMD